MHLVTAFAYVTGLGLVLACVAVLLLKVTFSRNKSNKPHVAVLVLGDVGRSPRMQYHAMSLADIGNFEVDLIGFPGSTPRSEVLENKHIRMFFLRTLTATLPRSLYIFFAPVKVVYQMAQMFWLLLVTIDRPAFILVQVCSYVRCWLTSFASNSASTGNGV